MQTKTLQKAHLIFLVCCTISACLISIKVQAQTPQPKNFSASNLTYKIIDARDNTYGYDVYANNKKIIHQPSIPALPGNEGFATKVYAEKVALLVISKIKKGETLPTVTISEMKKLHAVKS